MKTCNDCTYYYLDGKQCEAPMPLWVENHDPMSHFYGDEVRHMEPNHNAERCKMFRKRRRSNQATEAASE